MSKIRLWDIGSQHYRMPVVYSIPDFTVLPVGDITPHWTQLYAEDFNTPATAGNFLTTYPRMAAFDGFGDTSGVGMYSKDILTVHDSSLDAYIHYDSTTGKHYVACVLPNAYAGQLYGKVTWRMHMDQILQYKIVPLWWSARDTWADGEIDFPENGIGNPTQPININVHNVQGSPATAYGTTVPGVFTSSVHTYDFEWTPGKMVFSIDGIIVRTVTNPIAIPVNPMKFEFQMEVSDTSGNTIPDVANEGHVYIDWVCQYTYNP